MHRKTKLKIIIIISLIAFCDAFYLWYDWIFSVEQSTSMYFLPTSDISWWSSFCDINQTLSCSSVLSNPLSQIYWVPFPVIALFVYPIIILISLLGYFKKIKKTFKILLAMWIGWVMFNWYFIYQETFKIGAFCPLCLLCSAIIITIATLSGTEVRKKYIENKKK